MLFQGSDRVSARLKPVIESARDARSRTGCDVEHEDGRVRLRLWGVLPFTWSGNLSLHCHGAGVNILEVDARHLGSARWAASVLVEPPAGEGMVFLRGLDFLSMARHRPALVPLPDDLALASFRLEPPGTDGAARLRVSAPDRLGLLANLLARVLASGLRPREICARTRKGRAEDWLALEGQAGTPPDPETLAALKKELSGARGDSYIE